MLLKGHTLDYFFSLSFLDKMFVYTAMIKEQKLEREKMEFQATLAGYKLQGGDNIG